MSRDRHGCEVRGRRTRVVPTRARRKKAEGYSECARWERGGEQRAVEAGRRGPAVVSSPAPGRSSRCPCQCHRWRARRCQCNMGAAAEARQWPMAQPPHHAINVAPRRRGASRLMAGVFSLAGLCGHRVGSRELPRSSGTARSNGWLVAALGTWKWKWARGDLTWGTRPSLPRRDLRCVVPPLKCKSRVVRALRHSPELPRQWAILDIGHSQERATPRQYSGGAGEW